MGGRKDALIVSIDGGCEGIAMVASGALGTTAMQYPVRMGQLSIEAAVEFYEEVHEAGEYARIGFPRR